MHTSPDPRVCISGPWAFWLPISPSPLFAQAPCLFLPCWEAEIREAHADMSFCRARQWPQGSGPSSHETELSRDNPHKRPKLFPYQQKHAGATGRGVGIVRRGRGGRGPGVSSASGLELTLAMSPVLVALLLIRLLRCDSGSVHLFLAAQTQPGGPRGLRGPLSFLIS